MVKTVDKNNLKTNIIHLKTEWENKGFVDPNPHLLLFDLSTSATAKIKISI